MSRGIDLPHLLNPNLPHFAETINAYLGEEDFLKFGLYLLGDTEENRIKVENIRRNQESYKEKLTTLLKAWISKFGESAKWEQLTKAAEECKLNFLAGKIRGLYKSTEEGPGYGEPSTKNDQPAKKPKITEDELKAQFEEIQSTNTKGIQTQMEDLATQKILIQTVNDTEQYAAISQLNKGDGLSVYKDDDNNPSYYYVGKWGDEKIPVVIIKTSMGSDGFHGSFAKTKKALEVLPKLQYIFAVGVCGGIKGKVDLGDVVVSTFLQDCSRTTTEADKLIITSSGWQLDEKPFCYFLNQAVNKPKTVQCGMVLSANTLVKSEQFKNKLVQACPKAIAIEMEGHGIARACKEYNMGRVIERKLEFLVVKGVSDFANPKKDDIWQPQAAKNAVEALYEVMKKFPFGKL